MKFFNYITRKMKSHLNDFGLRFFPLRVQAIALPVAVVLVLLGGCTKTLELEPAQYLTNEEALNSDADVKQVLI